MIQNLYFFIDTIFYYWLIVQGKNIISSHSRAKWRVECNDQNGVLKAMIGPSIQKMKLHQVLAVDMHSCKLGFKQCDYDQFILIIH